MSKAGGRNALITAALVVAAIRIWMQVRGKATTPFTEWAIGWGATFFILSLISEAAPSAAGALSLIVVVSDFLKNGVGITTDISSLITSSEKSGTAPSSLFVASPFTPTPAVSSVTSRSGSPRENPSTPVGGGNTLVGG